MRKKWVDYNGAVSRLRAVMVEQPVLNRSQAQEVIGISPSVFSLNVLANSLWLAKESQDGRWFETAALIRHFVRMDEQREAAKLLFAYYYFSDEAFEAEYGKSKAFVFAPGTNLTVGGDN